MTAAGGRRKVEAGRIVTRRRLAIGGLALLFLAGTLVTLNASAKKKSSRAVTKRPMHVPQEPLEPPAREHLESSVPSEAQSSKPILIDDNASPFRGSATVRGRVVTETGEGVDGAFVSCFPSGYTPLIDWEKETLRTSTDTGGAFVFPTLPNAPFYSLRATKRGLSGASAGPVRPGDDQVQIQVAPVFYDRFAFVTDTGQPVSVCEDYLAAGWGDLLYASDQPQESGASALLSELGFQLPPLTENEVLVLYRSRRRVRVKRAAGDATRPGPQPQEQAVWLPDYGDVPLERRYRSAEEWPARSEVTVPGRASATGVTRCRFVFPGWKPPPDGPLSVLDDVRLVVRPRDRRMTRTLTRERNVSYLADVDGLQVYLGTWPMPLPCSTEWDLERQGRTLVIRPEYPSYGCLELLYDKVVGVKEKVREVLLARVDPAMRGHKEYREGPDGVQSIPMIAVVRWPGCAIAGPVQTGLYRIRLICHDGTEIVGPTLFEIKEGANLYEWR